MLRRNGVRAILGGMAFLAVAATTATAAPLTVTTPVQTLSVPLTTTNWSPSNFSGTVNPLNVAKFDPKLGTLESVNIGLSYTVDHNVTMTFSNASTISVTVSGTKIELERPNGSSVVTEPIANYTMSQSYDGTTFPHTETFPMHTAFGTATPVTLTSAADLALFTKSSPTDTMIKLPAIAQAQSGFTASTGNAGGGATVTAGVTVSVSYTYESRVPEPSTFAVLALGFGGYLMARRNRRRSASIG